MIVRSLVGAALLSVSFSSLAAPPEEWYLRLNGKKNIHEASLYVYEIGQGPTVVVLHGGFGEQHGYLLPLLEPLADRYHFVLYDQRGSLRSACLECDFSINAHVADLERLRTELKLDRMVLLGHSMGTFIAMMYAQRYPQHVAGLTLLGAMPPVRTEAEAAVQATPEVTAFESRPQIEAELKQQGLLGRAPASLSEKENSNLWHIRYASSTLYDVSQWRKLTGQGQAFYNFKVGNATAATMPRTWDFTPTLMTVPNGVEVIMGDHDFLGLGNPRWSQAAQAHPGHIEHIVIAKAGHGGWVEQPAAFQTAVDKALKATTKEVR